MPTSMIDLTPPGPVPAWSLQFVAGSLIFITRSRPRHHTWEVRTQRQVLLQREDRPECTFFVHERAIRLQVGSDQVMEEQLLRLMFKTHTLRIVPSSRSPRSRGGRSSGA